MKGFFIFVGLIALLCIVVVTKSDDICPYFYGKILTMEGGQDDNALAAFEKVRSDTPDLFKTTYQQAFQDRMYLGKYAYIFAGDAFYMQFAADTKERYLGSPFNGDDDFAQLLARYAHVADDHGNPQLAYTLYNAVAENFPNYSSMADVQEALRLLKARFGYSCLPEKPSQFAFLKKGIRSIGLLAFLLHAGIGSPALHAADADTEVSLDEAPSPTFTVTPTFSASPTSLPTATEAVPTPVESAKTPEAQDKSKDSDLGNPDFDKEGKDGASPALGADTNEDNGLVIIAPGAASPEDSLEAFGIDTPFNWREKKREQALTAPNENVEESIELNPPDTSDLKGQAPVAIEEPGKPASQAEDYDAVERAGTIVPEDDYQFDGYVIRQKEGRQFFTNNDIVYLEMEPGRQVYPGSIYSVFRDEGKVSYGDADTDLGHLIHAVCVIRIIRVDSENIMARVEKQYSTGAIGDGVRLRDPDRAKHYASLREAAGTVPSGDVSGQVVALENRDVQVQQGDHAYLNIGRDQGVQPGMRLSVFRDVPNPKDPIDILPGPVGKIGEVLIVSTQRDSSTALLLKAETGLRIDDLVRYR